MKPVVDLKRCFASKNVCTAIKACPVKAVSYIEVAEPILDKTLECNCNDPNRTGKISVDCGDSSCCGEEANVTNCCADDSNCCLDEPKHDPKLYQCGGNPYGRIIIDHSKCTSCGLCALECCGSAIDMMESEDAGAGEVKSCPCPNIRCKKHGNCEACNKSHKGGKTSYCNLKDGSFRKRLINFLFRKNRKKKGNE